MVLCSQNENKKGERMEKIKKVKMYKLMLERKKKGLTQEELSAQVGLKRLTIWKYENGLRAPTPETLKDIAQVLGCTVDDIL